MELRDLRALLAVVRTGSFTAAADELGYTQSAVSQQISTLEREVGHQLLHRRPVGPTPAGERLAEHAARILLRVEVAHTELTHLRRRDEALTVVACPLAAPDRLARALRAVRAAHAGTPVTVRTLEPEAAIAALARGAADVALVDGITAPDNPLKLVDAGLLHSTALVEVPLVVALTATHPLRRRREIDLDTLADAPWVMTPGLVQTSHQHHPAVVYAGTDLPTLLHLVAAGHGAALLPATAVAAAAEVVAIPVGAPPLVHRTEALTRRQHRAIDAELIDALRAA